MRLRWPSTAAAQGCHVTSVSLSVGGGALSEAGTVGAIMGGVDH
ncbi:MAG: hypothetical protein AB2556_24350 [Candidatus Thiodiazotropha sp.]